MICFYPIFGPVKLIKFFDNQLVLPRSFYTASSSFPDQALHFLFGSLSSRVNSFKANHFVPLIFKRNKKRPSSSSSLLSISRDFPSLPKKEKISSFTSFKNTKAMYSYFDRKTSFPTSTTTSIITTVSSSNSQSKTSSSSIVHSSTHPISSILSLTSSTTLLST